MLRDSLVWALVFGGLVWAVFLIFQVFGVNPGLWGIRPREVTGLTGILTSPLVHGSWEHIASNTMPMIALFAAILLFYRKAAPIAVLGIWIMTGAWVWIIGKTHTSHIGASGLVYGFAAYLFFSGVFRRDGASIAVALVVALMYGSMIWGVFPSQAGISWESHLFGGIAGVAMAWFTRRIGKAPKKQYGWEQEKDDPGRDSGAWNYRKQFTAEEQSHFPSSKDWD